MKKVKLNTAQMGVPAGQELEVVDRHTASLTLRTGDGRQIVVPHSAVDEIEEEFVPDYKSVLSREDSSPGDKKVDMFEEGFAAAKKLHDSAIEASAKTIYGGWSEDPEYVPWQDGGNSHKQEEARQIARENAAKAGILENIKKLPLDDKVGPPADDVVTDVVTEETSDTTEAPEAPESEKPSKKTPKKKK